MTTATTVFQWLVRVTGLFQIVLGLAFWMGYGLEFVPIHMVTGLLLVFGLWGTALTAGISGVSPGFVTLAVLWGVFVTALGIGQTGLLVGDFHWVIEALHLLVGLAAMGMADQLATRVKYARPREA